MSISDGSDEINQLATYRFTIVPSDLYFDVGTVIQTFISDQVSLQINSNGAFSICEQYDKSTNTTEGLSGCTYDDSQMMV